MILKVFRQITFPGGRKVLPGKYIVGEKVSQSDADVIAANPRWGAFLVESVVEAVDLDSSDDEIKAHLISLNSDEINAFWASFADDQLSDFLVNRASKERKDGWKTQQMGNMIEKYLGL